MIHVFASEAENNFFYGDINEVIWGSIAFFIIFGVFLWKGLGPIKRAMAGRSQRIADQIAAAEAMRAEAEAETASVRGGLGNVDEDKARIVADAHERAAIVKADLIARAESEVAEAKTKAAIEIEASKSQSVADLREEVVAMTIKATEAVVAENLTSSVQADLIEQYIAQVGAAR